MLKVWVICLVKCVNYKKEACMKESPEKLLSKLYKKQIELTEEYEETRSRNLITEIFRVNMQIQNLQLYILMED